MPVQITTCRMKEFRKKKGVTLEQLAQMVGISASILSRYERGVAVPSKARMASIAQSLDTTVEELAFPEYSVMATNYPKTREQVREYFCSLMQAKLMLYAEGKCEMCQGDAPFYLRNGYPYFEFMCLSPNSSHFYRVETSMRDRDLTHYIMLCPNCAAKLEVLQDPEDVEIACAAAKKHHD